MKEENCGLKKNKKIHKKIDMKTFWRALLMC